MTKETKDILLRLLQQHKELGISEQIDYQKHYLDSLINNSVALSDLSPEPIDSEMVDKQGLQKKMVDKWSIKPSLAEKLVDILDFVAEKDEFTTEQIVGRGALANDHVISENVNHQRTEGQDLNFSCFGVTERNTLF